MENPDPFNEGQDEAGPSRTELISAPEVEYTPEQKFAIDEICDWAADDKRKSPCKTLGGYAGTGKTVTIKGAVKRLDDAGIRASVVSLTGKAVSVLRNKGVSRAQTLHSLMYTYDPELDEFTRVNELLCDVVIVDEASMINVELDRDLMSFDRPVLYVGDMGQLPPIGDDPYLMAKPDLQLTTIHRQAAQSPIIAFATRIRECQPYRYGKLEGLRILPTYEYEKHIFDCDVAICGYNGTRCDINKAVRDHRGLTRVLEEGDRVVCLRNNTRYGVYNGMTGKVLRILDETTRKFRVDVEDDLGNVFESVLMLKEQFGKASRSAEYMPRGAVDTLWDYGYCLTCHKAQGSEWNKVVVVVEDGDLWDPTRWRYTAATRASKDLIFCCNL